jgi:hypothetical protein
LQPTLSFQSPLASGLLLGGVLHLPPLRSLPQAGHPLVEYRHRLLTDLGLLLRR